ncbi:MAG: hypothetical protein QW734_09415 [Candidatus Bathyarchaeia archaeon]
MSFDLSWLWELLNSIVSTMQSWFASLWQQAQNIVNTGQGIFSGLVALGSQLWDAFIKGLSALGQWLYDAFSWVWKGLEALGATLGSWLSQAYQWLASGIQWIGSGLYGLGQWLWNGILWAFDIIRNALVGLWNWIASTLSGIASAVSLWWNSVISGVNTWFTNLLKVFRQKIVTTIMVDVGITGMWKAGERILHPSNLKDIGYGLLGLALSPVVGYTMGKLIDAIVPLPSTETYPLIPPITGFEYTPPPMTIERPSPPIPPTAPPAPPIYGYVPVCDIQMQPSNYTYTAIWIAGKTLSLSKASDLAYETNSGEDYKQTLSMLSAGLSYETEVT